MSMVEGALNAMNFVRQAPIQFHASTWTNQNLAEPNKQNEKSEFFFSNLEKATARGFKSDVKHRYML